MNMLKSVPGVDPIEMDGLFPAPPARLFKAWTTPEEVVQWFGAAPGSLETAEIDLTVGGRWRFTFSEQDGVKVGFQGEYLEIIPDARLVFSWQFIRITDGTLEPTSVESRVEINLEAEGKATRMRLIHSATPDDDTRLGFVRGWTAGLGNLLAYVDTE